MTHWAYKSILTLAANPGSAATSFAAAAGLAQRFESHLDAVALGISQLQLGYAYMGTAAVVVPDDVTEVEGRARQVEAAFSTELAAQPTSLRANIDVAIAQIGSLGALVAARARYADLVLLATQNSDPDADAILEAVLFSGGAPALIIPTTPATEPRHSLENPKKITIAWNESRESMAAVRAALPLLRQADTVDVTSVDPKWARRDGTAAGAEICQMLVRHGVPARSVTLAQDLPRIADVLMEHALDQDADLLVMGAYTNSRLREALIGGTTRDMLSQSKIPVLMAH